MSFASFDGQRRAQPLADINMVPLIDVLLVLLVIFIVTAPLLTHSLKLELPQISTQVNASPAEKIEFAIDAQGERYWNGEKLSRALSVERFGSAAVKQPQPEVHLRADQAVAYRVVAQTLADASNAGLHKVGFVSIPGEP